MEAADRPGPYSVPPVTARECSGDYRCNLHAPSLAHLLTP